mmetsp:Transcript_29169/g.66908  ORF Transcript_29169/g.66908 Transcript_29169/m.66908 type:complete len:234 (-) Transcript_29169:375-1076(-)
MSRRLSRRRLLRPLRALRRPRRKIRAGQTGPRRVRTGGAQGAPGTEAGRVQALHRTGAEDGGHHAHATHLRGGHRGDGRSRRRHHVRAVQSDGSRTGGDGEGPEGPGIRGADGGSQGQSGILATLAYLRSGARERGNLSRDAQGQEKRAGGVLHGQLQRGRNERGGQTAVRRRGYGYGGGTRRGGGNKRNGRNGWNGGNADNCQTSFCHRNQTEGGGKYRGVGSTGRSATAGG